MADPYDDLMEPEKAYADLMAEEVPVPPVGEGTGNRSPEPPGAAGARFGELSTRFAGAATGLGLGGLPGAAAGFAAPDAVSTPGGRAAVLGASQGGTYGYADELGGLVGRFLAQGQPARLGPAFASDAADAPDVAAMKQAALAEESAQPSDYQLVRDRMRSEAAGAQRENAAPYLGGQMAGAIGASVAARRLVPGLGRMSAAGQGALEGGVGGLGGSDADLTEGQVARAAIDTALGTGAGAAGGYLGERAGEGLSALGSWAGRRIGGALSEGSESLSEGLRRWAQERALKSAGYIQGDLPVDSTLYERTLARGGTLLDEPGLIRPGNSVAEIRSKLERLVQREGANIGSVLDEADATAANPALDYTPATFNPYPLARDVEENIVRTSRRDPSLRPQAERVQRWVEDMLEGDVDRAVAGVPFSFREANRMKGNLQDFVYASRSGDVPISKELHDDLQRTLTNEIDAQVTPLLGPQRVAEFQNARRRYGTFNEALEKAQRGERREVGNQFLGLGDRLQGAAAASMDPTGGVATGLVSKAVRGRADSAAARGADALSRMVPEVAPETLAAAGSAVGAAAGRVSGESLGSWLSYVASQDPQAASRWMGYLQSGAQQGPEGLAAAHYELAQDDPQYQAQLRRAGGQQQ